MNIAIVNDTSSAHRDGPAARREAALCRKAVFPCPHAVNNTLRHPPPPPFHFSMAVTEMSEEKQRELLTRIATIGSIL
ncbi:hypothetical protein J6590_041397 [Homalodisca vitripennis]|nr:hypothetical protein J6590_041397 [Homalodisca vitripennis]